MARPRGLVPAAVATAVAAAAGAATRLAGVDAPNRAAAALTCALAVATCVGAGRGAASPGLRIVAETWAIASVAAFAAARAAGVAAPGGALVVGGMAAVAAGVAGLMRGRAADAAPAAFGGALIATLPAALLFVADPVIEWSGGTAASAGRAQSVLAVNPVGALTATPGGAGVDWLRQPILYDGPGTGTPGLSVIGQYYGGATPTGAFPFAAAAAGIGFLLAAAAGRRATMPV
jgi:hypothetical protein